MAVIRMQQNRWWKRSSPSNRYLFAALTAVEFLISFTFLGYIHIEPISITIAYLPILIAGCFLGVGSSTAMGVFFGLASLYKASSHYVMPTDKLFSPFLSGYPLGSLLLSVGSRALFGFLVGILFRLAIKSRHPRVWAGVVALFAPKLHSLLVYSAMGLLFPAMGYNFMSAFRVDASDLLLSLSCLGAIQGLWSLSQREAVRNFSAYLDQAGSVAHKKGNIRRSWILFLFFILCAAVASTFYFAQRMAYMLGVHGLTLSSEMKHDLLHLQIQSLFATLSLNFLLAICLLMVYKYLSYREYLGQLDPLTGVMGRKMFQHFCEKHLTGKAAPSQGWFLFVDLDYFKSINDTLGHPAGDMVLKRVAQNLEAIFSGHGGIGRMGGDEFAVLITSPMSQAGLRQKLDQFLEETGAILAAPERVSCSIGACRFSYPQDMQNLYTETDRLLYAAKRMGRACYVMGALEDSELNLIGG